jgi:hypothetical protein
MNKHNERDNSKPTYELDGVEEVEVIDLTTASSDELSSAPSTPIGPHASSTEQSKGKAPARPLDELFTDTDATESDVELSSAPFTPTRPRDRIKEQSKGKAPARPSNELLTNTDTTESDVNLTSDEDWNTDAFRTKVGLKATTPVASKVPTSSFELISEDTQAALAFLAEKAPSSTLDELRGAVTLMDLRYGTQTSVGKFVESMKAE